MTRRPRDAETIARAWLRKKWPNGIYIDSDAIAGGPRSYAVDVYLSDLARLLRARERELVRVIMRLSAHNRKGMFQVGFNAGTGAAADAIRDHVRPKKVKP